MAVNDNTIRLSIDDDAIIIAAPFTMNETIRAISVSKTWDKDRRAWVLADATPHACGLVFLTFRTMRMTISMDDEFNSRAVDGVAGMVTQAGVGDAMELDEKITPPVDMHNLLTPTKTKLKPRRHQDVGYTMIVNTPAKLPAVMLGWDMGSGKTKTPIDAICNLHLMTTIVVCPTRVVAVWQRQILIHQTCDMIVVDMGDSAGPIAKRAKAFEQALAIGEVRRMPVVGLVNYEAVWRPPLGPTIERVMGRNVERDRGILLSRPRKWDMVVADEIHKLKDPMGKASKFMSRLTSCVARRIGLSGTPFGQRPIDIYGAYRFLAPQIFGPSYTAFRARYAMMGGFNGHQVIGYQNLPDLRKKFYSIAHRVMKKDVLDLPPVTHQRIDVVLDAKERRVYAEMEANLITELESGKVTAANAMVKVLRAQQITGGFLPVAADDPRDPARIERFGESKKDALESIIGQLDIDEPIVVFCRFRADLDAVHAVAESLGRQSVELSGRRDDIGAYWEKGKDTVAAVQIQAGGAGVDLTRAAFVAYYSVGHSLLDYTQSLARNDRQGQTRSVAYYHLVAKNTIDVRVYAALRKNGDVIAGVLDGLKNKTSADELAAVE